MSGRLGFFEKLSFGAAMMMQVILKNLIGCPSTVNQKNDKKIVEQCRKAV